MTAPPVTPPATPPAQPAMMTEAELLAKVTSIIAKNGGDSAQAIAVVVGENAEYRRRHNADQEEIRVLKTKVPVEGAVVLTGDEAKNYPLFKALNLTIDQIKTMQTEHTDLKGKVAQGEYRTLVGKAAGETYNADTLYELLGMKGQTVVMKEMIVPDPKDSKKTIKKEVPHVRKASDDKAAEEDLNTYVERELKPFEVALRKVAGTTSTTTRTASVTEFPSQTSSTRSDKAPSTGQEVVNRHIGANYQPPSALTAGEKKE
jgi:hypothetical protein